VSYSEQDGQVVLRMSREDYEVIRAVVQNAADRCMLETNRNGYLILLNRLNEGNPNYTPYQEKP